MKSTLLAAVSVLGLSVLSNSADAAVGFTVTQGATHTAKGTYYSPVFSMPTLDYLSQGLVVHLDVLSLLEGMAMGDGARQARLGVDVYKTTGKGDITDSIVGVVQPGGGLEVQSGPDFDFGNTNLVLTAQCRMGAQSAKSMGFGMYVVPRIGFGYVNDELELAVGGGLQISAWVK